MGSTKTTKKFRGWADFQGHPLEVMEVSAVSIGEARKILAAGGAIVDLGYTADGVSALLNCSGVPVFVTGQIVTPGLCPEVETVRILTARCSNIELYDPESGAQPPAPRKAPTVDVLPPQADWAAPSRADLDQRNKKEAEIRDKMAADAAATAPSRRRRAVTVAALPSPQGGWSK